MKRDFRHFLEIFTHNFFWGVKILKINQGEESQSNQGDPHGEFLGTLLWGIKKTIAIITMFSMENPN